MHKTTARKNSTGTTSPTLQLAQLEREQISRQVEQDITRRAESSSLESEHQLGGCIEVQLDHRVRKFHFMLTENRDVICHKHSLRT